MKDERGPGRETETTPNNITNAQFTPDRCSDCLAVQMEEKLDDLTSAIRAIAHGGVHSPGGLEGVAMALADGLPGQAGVGNGLLAVADAINRVADALDQSDRARGGDPWAA